jgi:hypothetical protein
MEHTFFPKPSSDTFAVKHVATAARRHILIRQKEERHSNIHEDHTHLQGS